MRDYGFEYKEIKLTEAQRNALIANSGTYYRKYDAKVAQVYFRGEPQDAYAIYYLYGSGWDRAYYLDEAKLNGVFERFAA